MAEPLRIRCESENAIPPAIELQHLAQFGRHVVLEFPSACFGVKGEVIAAKARLVERLQPQLADWSVFDSGGREDDECITVLRVIPRAEVLHHADAIVSAAEIFRRTAGELMTRLAEKLKVHPEDFHDLTRRAWMRRPWPGMGNGWLLRRFLPDRSWGKVGRDCDYYFHGSECCFKYLRAGHPSPQVVEVCLGFSGEFGVLDPYFFAKFVRSTAGLEGVASLFRSNFHDGDRMLEILGGEGRLRRILGQWGSSGWVAVRRPGD